MIGYDLDGVIMPYLTKDKKWRFMNKVQRDAYTAARLEHYANAIPILKPEGSFVIITTRNPRDREVTEAWLKKNEINPSTLHMMDKSLNFRNIIAYKIEMILRESVDTFYEDDEKIIKALSKKLPRVTFILVPREIGKNVTEYKCE
jgi:uncharacterized HAD superfamily protein